ncbi:MAG: FkbM family methyltransferase [Bacteroidetes bacterium]|nr:FkbM family methyltransferase [Bacteroidota bacterium]
MHQLDTIFQHQNKAQLEAFEAMLKHQSPIIVYGAGNLGNRITRFLVEEKLNVLFVCDKNTAKHHTKLHGVEIVSIDSIDQELKEKAIWIVAIWSPMHSYVATKTEISAKGIVHIFNAAYLYQVYPDKLLPYYHFQTANYFIENRKPLELVYSMWADEESKRQYAAHLDCRINLNFEGLPKADVPNQYFQDDIFGLTSHETFVDIGSYDGDTFADFSRRTKHQFAKYFALEPDPENLKKLTAKVNELGSDGVVILPLAIGDKNEVLKFEATGGGGAGLSNQGNIEVNCTTIDDLMKDESPSFIKMDIEGAEMNALIGGLKTIAKHQPILAVCIYHLPDDLWTLPLFIKEHFPFYQIYCRTHQFDGLDFVMYCVPKK